MGGQAQFRYEKTKTGFDFLLTNCIHDSRYRKNRTV